MHAGACFAGLLLAAALGLERAAPAERPPLAPLTGPVAGAPAPAFNLKTLAGKSISLPTYRGKTLVLNTWASWCAESRREIPDLAVAASKLAKDGVVFLGVDTTEEAAVVRAVVAAKGIPYPQALDAGGGFARAYDVQYFPTTFVIDPQGVLRARYVGAIAPAQLARLVANAERGVNGRVFSALQARIDATLTDRGIDFSGDPASVEANVAKARSALAGADTLLEQSDGAAANATDVLQTRAEQSALRDKAIAALARDDTAGAARALLPRLRGDAARDRERWQDALDAYAAALAVDPADSGAQAGVAFAAGRLGRFEVAVDAERRLAELHPTDARSLIALGRAQSQAGRARDAYATFGQAAALAKRQAAVNPGQASLVRMLACVHLATGRAYAKVDPARARAEFEQLVLWAQKLPPHDSKHDMFLEEAQEAIVALGLAAPPNGASVSLVPWTGPDLPGSIPNTRKYRLAVVGTSGSNVALNAVGLPRGWVASFCTDRVCSPSKVTLAMSESRVRIVEFQLIPPAESARTPQVRVTAHELRD